MTDTTQQRNLFNKAITSVKDPLNAKSFTYKLGETPKDAIEHQKEEPTNNKMNYFAFDIAIRQSITDTITPQILQQEKDRLVSIELQKQIDKLVNRVFQLESIMEVGEGAGKNKFFDYMNDRLTEHVSLTKQSAMELEAEMSLLKNQVLGSTGTNKNIGQEIAQLREDMAEVGMALSKERQFYTEQCEENNAKLRQLESDWFNQARDIQRQADKNSKDVEHAMQELKIVSETTNSIGTRLNNFQEQYLQQFKVTQNEIQRMVTKKEQQVFNDSVQHRVDQMEYGVMDIRNMNLTTDTYLDKFMPFNIIKEICRFLKVVLSKEQMDQIEVLERSKVKQLYRYLIQKNADDKITNVFQRKLIKLKAKLADRFPNFNWEKSVVDKLVEEDVFQDLDAACTDKDKIYKAIAIMADGDTEVNPILMGRIKEVEAKNKNYATRFDALEYKIKILSDPTLYDEEGGYFPGKHLITEMRQWVEKQLNQGSSYVKNLQEDLDANAKKNRMQMLEVQMTQEHLLKEMQTYLKRVIEENRLRGKELPDYISGDPNCTSTFVNKFENVNTEPTLGAETSVSKKTQPKTPLTGKQHHMINQVQTGVTQMFLQESQLSSIRGGSDWNRGGFEVSTATRAGETHQITRDFADPSDLTLLSGIQDYMQDYKKEQKQTRAHSSMLVGQPGSSTLKANNNYTMGRKSSTISSESVNPGNNYESGNSSYVLKPTLQIKHSQTPNSVQKNSHQIQKGRIGGPQVTQLPHTISQQFQNFNKKQNIPDNRLPSGAVSNIMVMNRCQSNYQHQRRENISQSAFQQTRGGSSIAKRTATFGNIDTGHDMMDNGSPIVKNMPMRQPFSNMPEHIKNMRINQNRENRSGAQKAEIFVNKQENLKTSKVKSNTTIEVEQLSQSEASSSIRQRQNEQYN